ncbi:MAG TPA: hypothetical protein VF695_15915 [Sphingomonas sp.]|jgi:hypothetical protein
MTRRSATAAQCAELLARSRRDGRVDGDILQWAERLPVRWENRRDFAKQLLGRSGELGVACLPHDLDA